MNVARVPAKKLTTLKSTPLVSLAQVAHLTHLTPVCLPQGIFELLALSEFVATRI